MNKALLGAMNCAMNYAPPELHPARDLPQGLLDFLTPSHREFTPSRQQLVAKRKEVLARAHGGGLAPAAHNQDFR